MRRGRRGQAFLLVAVANGVGRLPACSNVRRRRLSRGGHGVTIGRHRVLETSAGDPRERQDVVMSHRPTVFSRFSRSRVRRARVTLAPWLVACGLVAGGPVAQAAAAKVDPGAGADRGAQAAPGQQKKSGAESEPAPPRVSAAPAAVAPPSHAGAPGSPPGANAPKGQAGQAPEAAEEEGRRSEAGDRRLARRFGSGGGPCTGRIGHLRHRGERNAAARVSGASDVSGGVAVCGAGERDELNRSVRDARYRAPVEERAPTPRHKPRGATAAHDPQTHR